MSFVNLLRDDVWTGLDIENRVKTMIRSRYSEDDEMKAARLSRKKTPTVEETNFVSSVDSWIESCLEEGRQATIDMQNLHKVFEVEKAKQRLVYKEVAAKHDEDENVINQELVDKDVEERSAAQTVIDSASSVVLDIVSARNREFVASSEPVEEETPAPTEVEVQATEEVEQRPEWLPPLPVIEEFSVIQARLEEQKQKELAQPEEEPKE